ncbi:MAG: biotin/lipoyl-binding protein [Candidatus Competibacteraceae bacterium]|nr:biotin/lipoyl-binding protein [Candidatus Competibacteraceae bacterium]
MMDLISGGGHHDFERIARKGMLVCILFVGGFLTWAALAPLGSAIVAPGVVKVWTNRKTVQHLDGGIVRAIYVADGSVVKKGDPLILLEDTTTSAALNILTDQRDALMVQTQRLLAEQGMSERFLLSAELTARRDSKIAALYQSELSLFEARRNNLNDQIKLLRDGIAQIRAAAASARNEIEAIQEGLSYTEDLVRTIAAMAQKGFAERTLLLQKKEALAEKKERLHSQMAKLADLQKQIADQELRVIASRSSYMEQAEVERKKTHEQMVEIEERLRPTRSAQERSI